MHLGMVGLGRMGGNMAERLRAKGHTVTGYDPRRHGALPLLICSLRFGAAIQQHLLGLGLPSERLIGLEEIYDYK